MKPSLPKIGTPREREILECAAQGLTDKEIAAKLGISRETVATYWKRIRLRLDGASRTEAVARALTLERDREVDALVTQNQALEEEISARKEAERQLKVVLKRLRALVGCVTSGILLEDHNRKILLVNPAFCTLLGSPIPPEELVGYDCAQAAIDSAPIFEDPQGFLDRIEQVLEGKRPVGGDLLRLADGRCLMRDYLPIHLEGEQQGHLWQLREVTPSESLNAQLEVTAGFGSVCARACCDLVEASPKAADTAIHEALSHVGEAARADRAYVVLYNQSSRVAECTHEWSAPGISLCRAQRSQFAFDEIPYTLAQTRSKKPLVVTETEHPQGPAPSEVELWKSRGAAALLAAPIVHCGEVVGLIGFDSVKGGREWPVFFVEALSSVGTMVGRLLCLADRV